MPEMNDQAIDTYRAQVAPLANVLQHTSDLLGQIESPLGELYNQAEASEDDAMRANVLAVWEKSQALAAQLPPFVAVLQAGGAALEEIKEQRNSFAQELNSLVEAIDSFDTDDSRLSALVEVIESDAMEYAAEMMYDDALESAEMYYLDTRDEEFFEYLMTNFNTSHTAIGQLLEYLRGDASDHRDDQRNQIIQDLLDTFKLEDLKNVS